MSLDAAKHESPHPETETPRWGAIRDLSLSLRDVVPVANVTERNQLLTQLGSTTVKPLFVLRYDAVPGPRVEWHDGTRWHVQGDTRLGRARLAAGLSAAATPSWTDLASVTATTLGGPCVARATVLLANGNSGADRVGEFTVALDGTTMSDGIVPLHLRYVAGANPNYSGAYEWESTPAAGSHTWTLRARGPLAAAVVAQAGSITVTEHP